MTQYLGLISFFIVVCGLAFTVWRWPGGAHMTFSQHVARHKSASVYYSLLFAVALPLLYLFFVNWFVPAFKLSDWFVPVMTASVVFQFLCTFVPETGGWKTSVHRILTGISGVLLLPLVIMIITSAGVPAIGKVLAGISLIAMVLLLVVALKNQRGYSYALFLQVGYYVLFFAPILYIAYV
ncbi:MAG TPA: hypothetical protein VK497_01480 [Candidatus Saccharimonadales bacterium]|nr:hypothetical protein [Candidatus Saccharimonadales bacterium]